MNQRPMLIEKEIEVKGYDIDIMGIVSNIVYVRWFEDLRLVFLNAYCPYQEMIGGKRSPILMKTEIEYKASLTFFDHPVGRCWMSNIGRSKWEMEFEIASGQITNCTGKQMGCFFDLEKKRPIPLPQRLVEQYEKETAEEGHE